MMHIGAPLISLRFLRSAKNIASWPTQRSIAVRSGARPSVALCDRRSNYPCTKVHGIVPKTWWAWPFLHSELGSLAGPPEASELTCPWARIHGTFTRWQCNCHVWPIGGLVEIDTQVALDWHGGTSRKASTRS